MASLKQIVRAFYDAYNSHDAPAAAALYAEDGEHREMAQGSVRIGPEEIGAGLGRLLEAFPDARWHVKHTLVDGERAAVTYELTGTLAADLGPFPAAGQALSLAGVHVFEEESGRLRITEDYWDSGTFSRQMQAGA
jgi:steroid delta-isomerase-like uncharacterized protein